MIEPSAFENEVHELHAFFERWFAGTAEPAELDRLDVLDDTFRMVGPDGRLQTVGEIRSAIEKAYGRRSVRIEIRNVWVHPSAPVGMYEEWQTADGEVTGRSSSAVMSIDRSAPNGLRWMHLQETWLPDARL
ncbi:MAG: hypothetical protein U9R47_04430 [Actinomycetota bacterium]|nr:hypothetical protein [Actinomycetota bacterium]